MKKRTSAGRDVLLKTAAEIADQFRSQPVRGVRLKLNRSFTATGTLTRGWSVTVGRLDGLQTGLEVWVDRYARHEEPKFSACFWSESADRIKELVKRAPEDWDIGRFGESDYEELPDGSCVLKRKLAVKRFNQAIEEHYSEDHFFGFYDYSAAVGRAVDPGFIRSAVSFFSAMMEGGQELVAPENEVFPREENRKLVSAHLARERSRFLADRCKQRDGYLCQVCRMTFAAVYGDELGTGFAEAHNVRPLATLGKRVKTRLEDLITVCSNCHRMLHRMNGEEGDVDKLRRLVAKPRRSRP
jgi:5-methylcytosine-specific restriction endonuclease McrA